MRQIGLISCVSKKQTVKSKASSLYTSAFFKYSLCYAEKLKLDNVFILSAKYGLVALSEEIEPYDVTLNKMRVHERKDWADKVIDQLQKHTDLNQDHFVILAGERYRQYLLPYLASYEIPLKGLSIGKQLQYLKRACNE